MTERAAAAATQRANGESSTNVSRVPVATVPESPTLVVRSPRWQRVYRLVLLAADLVALMAGLVVASSFTLDGATLAPAHVLALCAGWVVVLASVHAYHPHVVGAGADEFTRITDGLLRFAALLILVTFTADAEIPRASFFAFFLTTGAAVLSGRYVTRKFLHAARKRGHFLRRVLVIGSDEVAGELALHLRREQYQGYVVVGHWWPSAARTLPAPASLTEALALVAADTVAVTSSSELNGDDLRRISWQLEGSGVDIVVAPAVTEVAGPRIHVRPVAGLPLLYVEEPEFSGGRRLLKSATDRLVSALALVALLPVLCGVAAAIRLTSPGPVLFRQMRLGRDGVPFSIVKFRTMYDGADERFQQALHLTDDDHGMFAKAKDDPRVTPLGRLLRRFSIDELPQLLNVLRGEMSLVGPRPLPAQVRQEGDDARRRLRVRPGMTGLWQVSGRSDTRWEEAVRMDLYYVENWSLALDVMILWKTIMVVLKGEGAY